MKHTFIDEPFLIYLSIHFLSSSVFTGIDLHVFVFRSGFFCESLCNLDFGETAINKDYCKWTGLDETQILNRLVGLLKQMKFIFSLDVRARWLDDAPLALLDNH